MNPPEGLSKRSADLWREIVTGPISPSRAALLEEGLRCLDRLAEIRSVLAQAGLTSTSERSNVVHVHPLAKLEDSTSRRFASIWGTLNLAWRADIDGMSNVGGTT